MSEVELKKKDGLAILRRQRTMSLSRDVLTSWEDVWNGANRKASALYCQNTQKNVGERAMASVNHGV